MRLLALTGVVLVALVGASTARAHHLTGAPVLDASTGAMKTDPWATIIDRAVRPTTPGTVPQTTVDNVIDAARRKGRILPLLRQAGAMGLAGSLGWSIGQAAGPTVYRLIVGADAVPTPQASQVGLAWKFWSSYSPANWTGSPASFTNIWSVYSFDSGGSPVLGFTSSPSFYCVASACTGSLNDEWSGLNDEFIAENDADLYTLANQTKVSTENTPCNSSLPAAGVCRLLYRTETQMDAAREVHTITQAQYDALAAGDKLTPITYNAPGDLGTSADKLAAGQELGASGTQTLAQQAAEEALCSEAGLSGCTPTTIALPQPTINETYTQYIARLEALGWIGTATTTVTTVEHDGYGPSAPVRIIVTEYGATTTRTVDPLAWPGPAINIHPESDITIRYNPSTAPEAPGETGATPTTGTGTTVTWPDTTVPSAPALDFTPISDIDFGCKFPYGFLCYAVDFTEQFDVAADAPVFTFDMEMDVALGSFDLGTYEVDLEVMDAWMALWRDILSVVLVVGAIYFVATRMLGFKAGGDPGAAMDDVL